MMDYRLIVLEEEIYQQKSAARHENQRPSIVGGAFLQTSKSMSTFGHGMNNSSMAYMPNMGNLNYDLPEIHVPNLPNTGELYQKIVNKFSK